MNYKWIGAVLVIVGCSGFGFSMAASHRREERILRQILHVLQYMECELQYRLTSLPELCSGAGMETRGILRDVFMNLAAELDRQISPDVSSCMSAVLKNCREIPGRTRSILFALGRSLGRFDLPGQLRGLEAVRSACQLELNELEKNRDVRLRSYQTLGLCAGAALVILFL